MLFLQVSYSILQIHRKSIYLFIFLEYLVVHRGHILWLCKASNDGEEFHPSSVLVGFLNLRLSNFYSFVFFLKILSKTSVDGEEFYQSFALFLKS